MCCLGLDGETPSARLARWTSLFGESAFGGQIETKKARSVVALSRVPRGKRGAPVFASGCQLIIAPPQTWREMRAAVRPLVRMPTN